MSCSGMPALVARGKRSARKIAAITAGALSFCLVAAALASTAAKADETAPVAPAAVTGTEPAVAATQVNTTQSVAPVVTSRRADFQKQTVAEAVRHTADWVADSGDNRGLPFVVIDKQEAKVFVFDKDSKMKGSAWALVGLAPGDDSVPGIGDMPLTDITPDMRTTPAGRFLSGLGHDLGQKDVVWVDYKDAISMHRVINTDPTERRLERIVSKNPAEHRISYGCINVPAKFFDKVVDPTFKDTAGVVYILPEVHPMTDVFPHYYDVDAKTVEAAGSSGARSTTATLVAPEQ